MGHSARRLARVPTRTSPLSSSALGRARRGWLLASHNPSPVGDCTTRPSLGNSGGLFLPDLQARRVLAEYSNIAQVYSPIPRTVYFTGQIRILDDRLVRPETNLSQHGNRDEDEPALEGVGSVNRVSAHFCNGIPLVKLERE